MIVTPNGAKLSVRCPMSVFDIDAHFMVVSNVCRKQKANRISPTLWNVEEDEEEKEEEERGMRSGGVHSALREQRLCSFPSVVSPFI